MRTNKFPAVCHECRQKIEVGRGTFRKNGGNLVWLHLVPCERSYNRRKLTMNNPACPKCGKKDVMHLLPSYGDNCWYECGCGHSFSCNCK